MNNLKPIRSVGLLTTCCLFASLGCSPAVPQPYRELADTEGGVVIEADVWADNWFALYLGDKLLVEDSVSITTERSFNAESFRFRADYPIVLNFVVKDFKENDSGLEYIGSRRQQLGDGGFIAQFRNAKTGELLATTNDSWRSFVVHRGPHDEACADLDSPVAGIGPCGFTSVEEPGDWKTDSAVSNSWATATEFSVGEVRPKDGYDRVHWDPNAKLIWADDLKKDNTILCRIVIDEPSSK